ncbi:hypothetical protein KR009_007679 [Drosophila setifemur]|nr:hypothetical protein KR009_007679 [Drosophila setifemur]
MDEFKISGNQKRVLSCRQDIAARLSSRYANLNAPSSRDVTVIQSDSMDFMNRNFADCGMMDQDINNNVVTEVQQDPQPDRPPKIKYDLPKDHTKHQAMHLQSPSDRLRVSPLPSALLWTRIRETPIVTKIWKKHIYSNRGGQKYS